MSYFNSPKSIEELKIQYRNLTKQHHPDVGGSNEAMKAINSEYERLFKLIESGFTPEEKQKSKHNLDDGFREVIEKIIFLENIIIEICGAWVWVSGSTYAVKEQLKAAGLSFSGSKKMWYWRKPEETQRYYRGKTSIEEIRLKYGSERVEPQKRAYVGARG